MPPIQLSLVTGGDLSPRAFVDLYRALNDACERQAAALPPPPFPPLSVVVHVSGPVTEWGPPVVGPVVRRRTPPHLEVAVVIERPEWEELPREAHRDILIRRVGEAVEAAAEKLPVPGKRDAARTLHEYWRQVCDDFRAWPLPPDELLGPPAACPKCGARLRTRLARQCRLCGADWH